MFGDPHLLWTLAQARQREIAHTAAQQQRVRLAAADRSAAADSRTAPASEPHARLAPEAAPLNLVMKGYF
ncbi:MAG: hypothetical protein HY689_05220 [Chloroflexi bacterium]|nr:hypothetical protein [Chloroflexota bacterium]